MKHLMILALTLLASACAAHPGGPSVLIPPADVGTTRQTPASYLTPRGFVAAYPAPWLTGGGAMTIGPDKNVWVAGVNTIGRVTPTGTITMFAANDNGLSISRGPGNSVWFAPTSGGIGRISMQGHTQYYPFPNGDSAWSVTDGPDGNEWFSDPNANAIGKITAHGVVTEYSDPDGSSPQSIVSSGNLIWFIDQGNTGSASSTTDGHITEYTWGVPCFSNYNVLAKTDDGSVVTSGQCIVNGWYDAVLNIPNGESPLRHAPYALSVVNGAGVWGLSASGLIRFSPRTQRASHVALPSQYGGAIGLVDDPNGFVWIAVTSPPTLLVYDKSIK